MRPIGPVFMYKEVLLNILLVALLALASAGLFVPKKQLVRLPAGPSSITSPFGCVLPPGVSAAEADCKP